MTILNLTKVAPQDHGARDICDDLIDLVEAAIQKDMHCSLVIAAIGATLGKVMAMQKRYSKEEAMQIAQANIDACYAQAMDAMENLEKREAGA